MWLRRFTAGVLTALVLASVVNPAAAAAAPKTSNLLAPGVPFGSYDASGVQRSLCTAGFVVRDIRGSAALITAGHCDNGGRTAIDYGPTGEWQTFGAFFHNAFVPPFDGNSHDIGLISLNQSTVPYSSALLGTTPVIGAARPRVGEQLCKRGLTTGTSCGKVTEVTDRKVYFSAMNQHGDSGGPVYRNNGDGTVTAIGVTSARSTNTVICDVDENDNPTQCGGTTAAELVVPWMKDWGLSAG